jgi:hypothetical protein
LIASRRTDDKIVYGGLTPEVMLPLFAIAAEFRVLYVRSSYEGFEFFNQVQPMIWTLFDRYLLEMPVPLTRFDELC